MIHRNSPIKGGVVIPVAVIVYVVRFGYIVCFWFLNDVELFP
jgi:hypothetical protein